MLFVVKEAETLLRNYEVISGYYAKATNQTNSFTCETDTIETYLHVPTSWKCIFIPIQTNTIEMYLPVQTSITYIYLFVQTITITYADQHHRN